jgi:shikimate kinase
MKRLIFISGTMGIGKTTISKLLLKELKNSVFLDGDWCWNINPFNVNKVKEK